MKHQDFTSTIVVEKTPIETFNDTNNVGTWWTGEPGVEGSAKEVGDEFTYRFRDIHYSKQKVTELVPGKKIVWLVTESHLNFIKKKDEWNGTRICFEIFEKGNKTEIRFTHVGLTPDVECYNDCSGAWSSYIQNSLKKYVSRKEAGVH